MTQDVTARPIAFPLRADVHGTTARIGQLDYLNDLIEQVLFTAPGERVNRPDFGAGVGQVVFDQVSPEVAATTQLIIHGALQQWLGDLIDVDDVLVAVEESLFFIQVRYSARLNQQPGTVRFALQGGVSA